MVYSAINNEVIAGQRDPEKVAAPERLRFEHQNQ
jgi:hypothetical protein